MFEEPFAGGRSLVHAVDPRVRIGLALPCAVCLAVVRHLAAACAGLGVAALLLAISRPPLGATLRRLFAVNVFIAFLWLTVPFTVPGDVLASWGPLALTRHMHTYRTFGNMLGMVFVQSFDRSVRVYEAMLLRGFSGRFRSVTGFRATLRDGLFAALTLAGLAAVILCDVYPELIHV